MPAFEQAFWAAVEAGYQKYVEYDVITTTERVLVLQLFQTTDKITDSSGKELENHDLAEVVEFIAPLISGQTGVLDIRLSRFGNIGPETHASPEVLKALGSIDCSNIVLRFNDPSAAYLEIAQSLDRVTNLAFTYNGMSDQCEFPPLPVFEHLQSLTIGPLQLGRGKSGNGTLSFTGYDKQPRLENLVIRDYSHPVFQDINSLLASPTLKTFAIRLEDPKDQFTNQFLVQEFSTLDSSEAELLTAVKACPAITTIQGLPAASFTVEGLMGPNQREAYERRRLEEFCEGVWSSYGRSSARSASLAHLDGKFVFGRLGANDQQHPLLNGIPTQHLAQNLDECRYIIFERTDPGATVGTYSNGKPAREGITYVYFYDKETGMFSPELEVGRSQPPSTTTAVDGVGNYTGSTNWEAARAYILSLL